MGTPIFDLWVINLYPLYLYTGERRLYYNIFLGIAPTVGSHRDVTDRLVPKWRYYCYRHLGTMEQCT